MTISVKGESFIRGKEKLLGFQDMAVYIRHLTNKEYMQFTNFCITWFYEEETPVGYAIIGIVSGNFFEFVDDNETILEYVQSNQDYLYIPYFEIFKGYRGKGLGKQAVSWLKNKFQSFDIVVYTTSNSEDFWFHQNFEYVNNDWWMLYPTSLKADVA